MKIENQFDHSKLLAYSGYYIDKEKLKQSASGGGASAIAEAIIENKGTVFGAVYSPDFKSAEFACIERKQDIIKIKGSKYISTKKQVLCNGEYKSVYSLIEQKLKNGITVLFIGLGCDVAAVLCYLKSKNVDTSHLYTIDLICHGTTSPQVAKCYIEDLEKRYRSKITDFSVRYKKEGWLPKYLQAKFENGKQYCVPFDKTDYGYAFNIYKASWCYTCKFKGENHKADITVGDHWGLDKSTDGYNNYGVSLFIVRTERGQELINMIDKDNFSIRKTDVEFALDNNKMYYQSTIKSGNSDVFGKNLAQKGLHYATVKNCGRLKYFLLKKTKLVEIMKKLHLK